MQKEISDFLKMAYEHGRVKDLKDAFEEYPVDEEWHKGKIENSESYSLYEIGIVNYERIQEYKKSFYDSLKNKD